jgi:hypothetical protein
VSVHPAALVLAVHQPIHVSPVTQPGERVRCDGDDWIGPWCEFATHQAAVLAGAGLLAETMEPARRLPVLAQVESNHPAKQPAWPIGDVR